MGKLVGIYKIINLINNKVYVGSAVNIKNRFKTHKRLLKNHKHFNNHLQSSYIKYGEGQFRYDIIETTSTEELLEKEVCWIKLLNANNNEYGYNKRLIVNSNLGIKLSEETRRKLSESHLGHKRSDESNRKIIESQYKKICQFDRDGTYIKSYNSLQDAAKELNCKYTTSITACLKKRLPSALGFLWCYEHEKDNFVPIETKKRGKKKIKLKVTCIFTNKITIFESITDAINSLKVSSKTVYKGIKEKNYKNLIWEKI
jgi:group I intron endonuclease